MPWQKKTGWSFELIYSKCRPNTVPLHKFLCFSEEQTTGDFSGRFHGPAVPVSSFGKCKSGSGCLPVRTSSAQQGGAWNRNTHRKILHMLNHWTSVLSWYQGISITAQDLTTQSKTHFNTGNQQKHYIHYIHVWKFYYHSQSRENETAFMSFMRI